MEKKAFKRIAKCCISAMLAFVLVCSNFPQLSLKAEEPSGTGTIPANVTNLARNQGVTITISNGTNAKPNEQNSYEMPHETWCKAFLVDGDYNNGWSTNPYDNEPDRNKPVTITMDLLKTYNLQAVSLVSRGIFPTDYSIYVSEDQSTWIKVVESLDNEQPSTTQTYTHTFEPVYGRYVKLDVTKRYGVDTPGAGQSSDGKLVQLGEIEIYGNEEAIAEAWDKTKIESYCPGGYVNISANKPVEASSSYERPDEGFCKNYLTNGVLGSAEAASGWTTNPYDQVTDPTVPAWARIDLKNQHAIRRVVIFPRSDHGLYGNGFPQDFSIELSNDANTWVPVHSITGITSVSEPYVVELLDLPSYRYIRLNVTKRFVDDSVTGSNNDGKLVQLDEIAVFGVKNRFALSLNKTSLELVKGEKDRVTYTVEPKDFDMTGATWVSDNPDIATVDDSGNITAVKEGETTLRFTVPEEAVTETVQVSVTNKKFSYDDNILISIFWPPTLKYMSGGEQDSRWDEQYRLLQDADINLVNNVTGNDLNAKEINLKMAEYAHKYGMVVSVADQRLGGNTLSCTKEELAGIIEEYRNVPGVAGYYILDEPYNPNVFNEVYRTIKETDPESYAHLNFLPYASYGNVGTYQAQMDDWLQLNRSTGYEQDYLMYDLYPYPYNSSAMNRVGFLTNMSAVWEVGRKNNVKTGTYLQSVCIPGAYRVPSPSEIRYEAMMAMAFGYKQVSYFTWFTPSERNEPFENGIIGVDGQPNATTYPAVCTLNKELHALGKTLINLDAHEIYLNGETWGMKSIPSGFPVQPKDKTNYTVSLMKDKNTSRNYIMVVNNDYTNSASFSIKFDNKITGLEKINAQTGNAEAVTLGSNNELAIQLNAGDGVLYACPTGYDYPTDKTSDDRNLARSAMFTANTSVGADGMYICRLNDGIRCDHQKDNGWKSVADAQNVEVTIDLKAEKTFNRIDLYPVLKGFILGEGYPKGLSVDVSNDGKTWDTVNESADLVLSDLVPSITFPAETKRYIRIRFTDLPDGYAALSEIEVFNDDGMLPPAIAKKPGLSAPIEYSEGDNIIKKKPIAVSSTTPDNPYDMWGWASYRLNDGSLAGGWTSNVKINNDQATAREWCAFDLCDLYDVKQIKIYAMAGSAFPIDYSVQTSTDGRTWKTVKKVTGDAAPASSEYRIFDFTDPERAGYIRVYGEKLPLSGADGYLMQIGEVEAYGSPVTDTQKAEALLTTAADMLQTLPAEEKQQLQEIITELQTAVDGAKNQTVTQSKLDSVTRKLEDKILEFQLNADKLSLKLLVEEGGKKVETEYTKATWKPFYRALEEGKQVLALADAAVEQVQAAAESLRSAMGGLEKVSYTIDDLRNEIAESQIIVNDPRILNSLGAWMNYQAAINSAVAVSQKTNPTDEEIFQAVVALKAAKNKLLATNSVRGHSLTLDGSIGVNFYFTFTDEIKGNKDAYVLFSCNEKETKVNVRKAVLEEGAAEVKIGAVTYDCYKMTCQVLPKQMNTVITAKLYAGEGDLNPTNFEVYTVKEYLDSTLTSEKESLRKLAKAMRDYGAYTQINFNYQTDRLVAEASELTDMEQVTIPENEYTSTVTKLAEDKVVYKGISLDLQSETVLRVYFEVKESSILPDLKATVGENTGEIKKSGNLYYVEVRSIKVRALGDIQDVKVSYRGEVQFGIQTSPLSYAERATKSEAGVNKNTKNLLKALYLYHLATNEYFNANASN